VRILIFAIGSRGDVQPYVALGLGLKGKGHHVRIAASLEFKELIETYGLDFFGLTWNSREFMSGPTTDTGRNMVKLFTRAFHKDKLFSNEMLSECVEASRGMDVAILTPLAYWGAKVRQPFGIPKLMTSLAPVSPTREFPQFIFPSLPNNVPFRKHYNLLSYTLSVNVSWTLMRKALMDMGKETPEFSRPPILNPWYQPDNQQIPILYGYSPSVIPPPSDWGDWLMVTGFWFLDRPSDWKPPMEVLDFLGSGKTPIFIGLGSLSVKNPELFANQVFEALAMAGERAIFAVGWSDLKKIRSPKNVLMLDAIPHDWIFGHVSAVVHHGGAGVFAASLRAGLPSLAVPHFADQFLWGDRIEALGVGPKSIPRQRLTPKQLADAITKMAHDKEIRLKAAELGKKIQEENGVSRAVECFESWAKSSNATALV